MSAMLTTSLPSSRFIGRVGLLAATLGVGIALVAAPGVARADETGADSGSKSSDSSGSSDASASTPSRESTPADKPASTSRPPGGASAEKNDAKEDDEPKDEAESPGSAADHDDDSADVPEDPAAVVEESGREHNGGNDRHTDDPPPQQPPKVRAVDPAPVARSVEGSDPAPAAVSAPASEPAVVAAPAVVVEASPEPPKPEIAAPVDDAVAASPSGLPTPGPVPAPVANPLEWALLGWVRRQSEQADPAEAVALVSTSTLVDNQPPEFDGPATYDDPDADGVVTGSVSATDPDGHTVTYSGTAFPSRGGVVVNDDGTFAYTPSMDARIAASRPDADHSALFDRFEVTATDDYGASATIEVVVPIKPIYFDNAAPVIDGAPVVNEPGAGGVVTGRVIAYDPDGDPLTYTAVSNKGTVVFGADGSFTYTPTDAARHAAAGPNAAADGATVDSLLVTVTDDRGEMASVTVQVAITPANAAPVFGTPTLDPPNANGAVTGRLNVGDTDGDAIVVLGNGSPGKGTVVVRPDGTFTYTPYPGARHAAAAESAAQGAREDFFTVTVTDRHGATVTTRVTVPVAPANTAPVYAGGGNAIVNGTVSGTVRFVDPDGDRITYAAGTRTTEKGVVTVRPDGSYVYTPTRFAFNPFDSSARTDTFTVTARDGYGGVGTTVVTVPVSRPISSGGGGGISNQSTPPAPQPVSTVVQSSNQVAAERQRLQRETDAAERLLKDLEVYMLWREAQLTRSPNDPAVLEMVNSVFATNFPGLDLGDTSAVGGTAPVDAPPSRTPAPGSLAAALSAAGGSAGTRKPVDDAAVDDIQMLAEAQARQLKALEEYAATLKQTRETLQTITQAMRDSSGGDGRVWS